MTTLNQNAMLIDGLAKCRDICADFGYSLDITFESGAWHAVFYEWLHTDGTIRKPYQAEVASSDRRAPVIYTRLEDAIWSLLRDERETRGERMEVDE